MFLDITLQELDKLKKNYFSVPPDAVVVPNEQDDEEYNLAEAFAEMEVDIERRKKANSWKGKMKEIVKGIGMTKKVIKRFGSSSK